MQFVPSLWMLGLTLALLGPILIGAYVRRVEERALRRTQHFLSQVHSSQAQQSDALVERS